MMPKNTINAELRPDRKKISDHSKDCLPRQMYMPKREAIHKNPPMDNKIFAATIKILFVFIQLPQGDSNLS